MRAKRSAAAAILAALALLVAARPVRDSRPTAVLPYSVDNTVTATRQAGALVIETVMEADGRLGVTVTDTRADDPGWAVVVDAGALVDRQVIDHTPAFNGGDDVAYAQQVDPGQTDTVVAQAPAGHGLGIAHVSARLTGDATVTIV